MANANAVVTWTTMTYYDTKLKKYIADNYMKRDIEWQPSYTYNANDLAIYDNTLYMCLIPNSDATFIVGNWVKLGGDGSSAVGICADYSALPTLTATDKKIYYCINDATVSSVTYLAGFYLWAGAVWTRIMPALVNKIGENIEYEADGTTVKLRRMTYDGNAVMYADDKEESDIDFENEYTPVTSG